MPKPKRVWMLAPAKIPKPSVPEFIKEELTTKSIHLIENTLKPKYVLPPKPDARLNYITDISGKWHRSYFYFTATYACPKTGGR